MRRLLITAAAFLLSASPALANGEHVEEESGIGTQFNELLPFHHIGEGHWIAVILSIILWIALIYTIYSVIKSLTKK